MVEEDSTDSLHYVETKDFLLEQIDAVFERGLTASPGTSNEGRLGDISDKEQVTVETVERIS
jgi:hypothetical protein